MFGDVIRIARHDGFLAGAADQTVKVRAHGHARDRDKLDPVFGHSSDFRRLDDLREHRHLDASSTSRPARSMAAAIEGQGNVGLFAEVSASTTPNNVSVRPVRWRP